MNPRRSSQTTGGGNHPISISTGDNSSPFQNQTQTSHIVNSIKLFLKKPHAFPFLLFIFLLLTWVSLRVQHSANFSSTSSFSQHNRKWDKSDKSSSSSVEEDQKANLVRFPSSETLSDITKDKRGWLMDPLFVASKSGIPGGAQICASLHVGEIRPGSLRGNHRHNTCNETFLIWGAKTKFRLENNAMDKGYAEVIVNADDVAVVVSPSGTAHALVNIDPARTTSFLGCQDNTIDYNSTTTDFKVWSDL